MECTDATPPEPDDDSQRAGQEAAQAVVDLFRRLDPDVGNPHLEFAFSSGGGRSVGLSAVIAYRFNQFFITGDDIAHVNSIGGEVKGCGCHGVVSFRLVSDG